MLTPCSELTHPVGLHIGCLHLCKKICGGELMLVLQVDLKQSIVMADIISCTWNKNLEVKRDSQQTYT